LLTFSVIAIHGLQANVAANDKFALVDMAKTLLCCFLSNFFHSQWIQPSKHGRRNCVAITLQNGSICGMVRGFGYSI
jgi:hypothetical protein